MYFCCSLSNKSIFPNLSVDNRNMEVEITKSGRGEQAKLWESIIMDWYLKKYLLKTIAHAIMHANF